MSLEGFLTFLHEKQSNNQTFVSCYLNAASELPATLASMREAE